MIIRLFAIYIHRNDSAHL